jgi:hypothetical protein
VAQVGKKEYGTENENFKGLLFDIQYFSKKSMGMTISI